MHHFDFSGRTIVITGGGSGIGKETALQFAEHGANVVVADVDDEHGASVAEAIGNNAVFVQADVTNMDQLETMVTTAVDEFGQLDFAFNNAGIGGEQVPTGDLSEDAWHQVIDINLNGVWRSMKAELDVMADQATGGAIVNTSSILGKVGFASASAYVAAKHGVLGLTKTAAWEYAQAGIRVNAVCPGFIETPLLEAGGITEDEETLAQIEGMHSQGRLGQPEEIADAVMWLCSDGASFTNGEALTVDSGYTSR